MRPGASPAAVQRILRHSDPRITTETYGHLLPGYQRDEVDRLQFGDPNPSQGDADASSPLAAPLLQQPDPSPDDPKTDAKNLGVLSARHARFEPATFGSGGAREQLAGGGTELQVAATIELGTFDRVQSEHAVAANRSSLAAPLLQAAVRRRSRDKGTNGLGSFGEQYLLTVKETAEALRVCTATVHSMIERGELNHARVSNAIRVVVRADSA